MHTRYRSENHDAYATLRVSREDGIARVTLDNPPSTSERRPDGRPPALADRAEG